MTANVTGALSNAQASAVKYLALDFERKFLYKLGVYCIVCALIAASVYCVYNRGCIRYQSMHTRRCRTCRSTNPDKPIARILLKVLALAIDFLFIPIMHHLVKVMDCAPIAGEPGRWRWEPVSEGVLADGSDGGDGTVYCFEALAGHHNHVIYLVAAMIFICCLQVPSTLFLLLAPPRLSGGEEDDLAGGVKMISKRRREAPIEFAFIAAIVFSAQLMPKTFVRTKFLGLTFLALGLSFFYVNPLVFWGHCSPYAERYFARTSLWKCGYPYNYEQANFARCGVTMCLAWLALVQYFCTFHGNSYYCEMPDESPCWRNELRVNGDSGCCVRGETYSSFAIDPAAGAHTWAVGCAAIMAFWSLLCTVRYVPAPANAHNMLAHCTEQLLCVGSLWEA